MNKRICIISDAIEEPFDEGVKIFVYNLIKELSKKNTVISISKKDVYNTDICDLNKKVLPKNKLCIGINFAKEIRKFKADIIIYIPVACATIFSFLRSTIIKKMAGNIKTVLITLQPRRYSKIEKILIPYLSPDLIFAQSEKTKDDLNKLGCKVKKIFTGVDLKKFIPGKNKKNRSLRRKYKLPEDKYIVLHVGHINRNRNIQIMEKIQKHLNVQTLVVGSTSTQQDMELAFSLRKNGVIIIDKSINNIEEIYQCADCYVFPVFNSSACIEMPLSIFEALACNTYVISTKYGDLATFLEEQHGIKYCNTEIGIIESIKNAMKENNINTRKIVEEYSWENITNKLIESAWR